MCCLLAVAAATAVQAADLQLQGSRLVVEGRLDGSAVESFKEQLSSGKVKLVVFENSLGGSAEVAGEYARAIQAAGVNTEAHGQCSAACAYAFLAGRERRFGRGLQVNALMIPVAVRPNSDELPTRWQGDDPLRTLADFDPVPTAAAPIDRWQPEHAIVFTSTPTLFGRVYNSFYCDGTQGRDTSRCEVLSNADPHKLGVLTP